MFVHDLAWCDTWQGGRKGQENREGRKSNQGLQYSVGASVSPFGLSGLNEELQMTAK